MADHQLQPHKVTKPIQLVAAWLTGLVIIDGMFLGAAASVSAQTWTHDFLVVAAVVNVPIFLGAIFLLQTKFRAELQEDSFYSEYLSKRTSQLIKIDKNSEQDAKIASLELKVTSLEQLSLHAVAIESESLDRATAIRWDSRWLVAVNSLHPQVYEIVNALHQSGVPVENMFGQHENDTPPERWTISINHGIPIDLQVALLRALIAFDFSGFNRWAPVRDAEEFEDVYIGGYGNESMVPFDDRLKELLARPTAETLLDTYYRANNLRMPMR